LLDLAERNLTAKVARNGREELTLAPGARVCPWADGGRKLVFIIEVLGIGV
jgi:hypothetical protein